MVSRIPTLNKTHNATYLEMVEILKPGQILYLQGTLLALNTDGETDTVGPIFRCY